MTDSLACLILAAGQGTRMRSALPKPLHKVAGRPMVAHVLAAAESLSADRIIIVIGPEMEALAEAVQPHPTAVQAEPRGTGDAVKAGLEVLGEFDGDVLVLFGDTPLITAVTLEGLRERRHATDDPAVVVAAIQRDDPTGYGRVVCDAVGRPQRIVEDRDADPEQKKITRCNGGLMLFNGKVLPALLAGLETDNAQKAYYLTDTVALARSFGHATAVVDIPGDEVLGVNTRAELAAAEAALQRRLRAKLMAEGVTMTDPNSVFLSWDTVAGRDVVMGPSVVIGPGVTIGSDVEIRPFCHLEGVTIGDHCAVGPFARLRPGSTLAEGAHVGNFVELKNTALGAGAKASHLTYLGDAEVGARANIGAGTITCNYDGFAKHRTTIGEGAFIGSDTALVAPVEVGAHALVGAGSVVTRDVPEDTMAIARGEQKNLPARGMNTRRRKAKDKKEKEQAGS